MSILRIGAGAMFFAVAMHAEPKEAPLPQDLPPFGAEKSFRAPVVRGSRLANGLTLWLAPMPGFPKIAFALSVRGGLAADPANRPGISELLSKAVDQGTKSRTAREIAQQLQAAGGDLAGQVSKDALGLNIALLSAKVEQGLDVLADVVQHAAFPDAEVELAKRNLADDLRQREAEPSFLASRAMARVLFGGHPYQVTAPTQDSIAAATPAELRAIFAQRFRPDQAVLVAVGDFAPDAMFSLLKTRFGGWQIPEGEPVALPSRPSATLEHAVFLVTRPESVQTTLMLGSFGPRRSDPDFEASQVANTIYGGGFSSRLVSNIREEKGYTYSPHASLKSYREAAEIVTTADVRNGVTGPSLNEIVYELNRMATTSPTDDELSKAKRYLVGTQALGLQARLALAGELAYLWVNGLPSDEIAKYGQKVAATASAKMDVAARRYFPAARTAIVAVGEEKVIREALAPFNLPIHPASSNQLQAVGHD